jgi:pimeloyl-ACP methyl ester carboxylesterase
MRERNVQCLSPSGLHRMAYTEWGEPDNPRVLLCAHGLTRSGRDFDFLAQALSDRFRVVCPDVVGRGRSDWLRDKNGYLLPQYVSDMVTLLARLDAEEVCWLGTSMGGLIGMALAAQEGTPVARLLLNDVGPRIAAVSLQRIGQYLGNAPKFASIEEAERYIRAVSAPFGALTDAQWRHLALHVTRQAGGGVEMAYDPGIAEPYRKANDGKDIDLWPLYEAVRCPTLLVRGAESDLLTRETAQEMGRRGPRARVVEVAGVGHAPMFLDEAQVAIAREFFAAD